MVASAARSISKIRFGVCDHPVGEFDNSVGEVVLNAERSTVETARSQQDNASVLTLASFVLMTWLSVNPKKGYWILNAYSGDGSLLAYFNNYLREIPIDWS